MPFSTFFVSPSLAGDEQGKQWLWVNNGLAEKTTFCVALFNAVFNIFRAGRRLHLCGPPEVSQEWLLEHSAL